MKDRYDLIQDVYDEGVEYIVDCVSGEKELAYGLQLAKKFDFVYLCISDNQHYVEDIDLSDESNVVHINSRVDETVKKLQKHCAANKKIVGYGECWMDFRRVEKTPEAVKKASFWFSKDLEIAKRLGLPPVIHSGNADYEAFDVVKNTDMPDYGYGKGMLHCYLGPPQMALDYIALGYLISVTGLVTHRSPRGRNLVDVVKVVPLEKMLIETDCPYLTPEPFRDRRNDSSFLRLTVDEIAKIKNVTPQEVAEATTANAKAFYGIA